MFETAQQFAKRTGFTYRAVCQLAMQGEIPFMWVGNKRMIPVEKALQTLERITNESLVPDSTGNVATRKEC
jgi:hypothetical protein